MGALRSSLLKTISLFVILLMTISIVFEVIPFISKVDALPVLYECYNTGDDTAYTVYSDFKQAQTFTIGASGSNVQFTITSVKIKAGRTGSPGIVTVQIRGTSGGAPDENILSSGSFDGDALPTGGATEWVEVSMSSYTVSPDTQYALVLSSSGTSSNTCNWRADSTSPAYSGGSRWVNAFGGGWSQESGDDFMFEIWGEAVVAPTAATLPAADIGFSTATLQGKVVDKGSSSDSFYARFRYKVSGAADWIVLDWQGGNYAEGEIYTANISGLNEKTEYEFQTMVNGSSGESNWTSSEYFKTDWSGAPGAVYNLNSEESFSSIQAAIDDNDTLDGHTIRVNPGTYQENVVVDKELTIKSLDNDYSNTIIDGMNDSLPAVKIVSNNVTIQGFHIKGGWKDVSSPIGGIRIYDADYATIKHNYFTDNDADIYGYKMKYCRIYDNIANQSSSTKYSFTFLQYCSHNLVYDNILTGATYGGITFQYYCDYNKIYSNYIRDKAQGVAGAGIVIATYSDYNEIYNNDIRDGYIGTEIETGSSNNTLRDNIIRDNSDAGLYLNDAYYNEIYNNYIQYNEFGIEIGQYTPCNNNLIYNNVFSNNNLNAWDNGTNIWNVSKTSGINIVGSNYLGGNYWDDYFGEDTDGDGLGDTYLPYNCSGNIVSGGDYHPLLDCPPLFSNENPANGSTNVSISTSVWSVDIEDPDGNTFNWSIETSPNVGSNSSNDDVDGTKICSLSNLQYSTIYTVYVNATDGNSSSSVVYWFKTESVDTVYVDDDADPSWYDSTHLHTIQEGIDNVCDGGTVYIWNGTYSYAYIDKNVSVIGNSSDGVVIDAGQNTYGLRVGISGASLHDIEISGLVITNFTGGGIMSVIPVHSIYSIDIHNVVIEDSILTNDSSAVCGIRLFGNSISVHNVVIRNLYIGDTALTLYGIYLDGNNNVIYNVEMYNFSVDTSCTSDYIEIYGINFITGYDTLAENVTMHNFYWNITRFTEFYICAVTNYGTSRNCDIHDMWFSGTYTDWAEIDGFSNGNIENCSLRNLSIYVTNESSSGVYIYGAFDFSGLGNSTFSNFSVIGTQNKEVVGTYVTVSTTSIFGCSINNIAGTGVNVITQNNIIYHNSFINNAIHAVDNGANNQWDNGYPSGGNYWDDYTGSDGNGDGIGDTPYDIFGTANSQDRYPLWSIPPEYNSDVSINGVDSISAYSFTLNGSVSGISESTECGFWIISGYYSSEPTFSEDTVDYNISAGYFSSDTTFTKTVFNMLNKYPYWVKAWAKTSSSFEVSSNTINFTTGGYSTMWDGLPRSGYGFRTLPLDFITDNPSQGNPYYGNFSLEVNDTETEGFSVTKWLSDGIDSLNLSFYYATAGNSNIKIVYYSSTGTLGSETIYFNSSQSSWSLKNYDATFSSINKSLVRKVEIIFSSSSGYWLDVDNIIVNVDGWNTVYESFGDEWGYYYPSVYTLPSSYIDDITPYSANNLTAIKGGDGGDSNCIFGFKVWDNSGNVYWVTDIYGGDTYYANISNLRQNTKYYYVAFANNTAGQDLDTAHIRNFTTSPVVYSPIYYFTTALIQISNETPLNESSNVTINPSGTNLSATFTHPYTNGTMDIKWYYYDWDIANFTLFANDTNVTSGTYEHLCSYFNQSGMLYYWYVDAYEHDCENSSVHSTALYSFSSENFTITLEDITPASGTTNLSYNPSGITTSVYLNYSFPSSQTFDLYWYWYNLTSGNWTLYGSDLNSNEGNYSHICPMLFEKMYWRVDVGNITLGFYNFSLYNYSGIQILNVYPQRGEENVTLFSNGVQTSVAISGDSIPSGTTLNWYFYNWTSEEWELYASDNNIQSGYTYSHYLTYARYGYISYYWRVDAEIFTIETFNFSSNLSIIPSSVYPVSGSTVSVPSNNSVKLQADVSQVSGSKFNLTFYFLQYTVNETGYITDSTWIPIANFTNVGNGTYIAYTPQQKYYPSLTYYWRLDAKEVDNPLDPTIGLYNFTPSPETPSVWLISPANGSVNQSYDNVNLTWNASDPTNDSLSYWVTFGTSPSNMYLMSLNQTVKYFNTGSLLSNTTYYWQIIVWDDKGWWNQSEIWSFTTEQISYNYHIFLRNEEDFQLHTLDPNATYELVVYWKEQERTDTYIITSNSSNYFNFTEKPKAMRLYVYYPIYNSTNSSIIEGNGSYFRTRVPMYQTENITFWLAKYPQNLVRYVYSIDDRSASFVLPDVILRFYIYNETEGNIGIVDEDWMNAENSLGVFLLYNSRYYLYVMNGYQPPTVIYDAGFTDADSTLEKTIIIQPEPAPPLGWEDIKYNAYKYGNDSIYIYFEDDLHLTNWINITIYEYVNGTPYVLDNVNVSTYKFVWIKTPVNLSRYHDVKFSFHHSRIGTQHSLHVGIPVNIEPIISYVTIDNLLTVILGANPFGWFATFIGGLVLVVSFTFSPKYQGLSLLALGLLLLFVVITFDATAILPMSLLTFLLLVGVLQIYYERKREGGGL